MENEQPVLSPDGDVAPADPGRSDPPGIDAGDSVPAVPDRRQASRPPVEDAESFDAVVRVRKGGLKKLAAALGEDGFVNLGRARVQLHEGELLVTIDSNVGKTHDYEFLGLSIDIPFEEGKQDEKDDRPSPGPAAPAV